MSSVTANSQSALPQIATNPTLLRMAAQERALSRAALRIFSQDDEPTLLEVAIDAIASLLQVDAVAVYVNTDGVAAPRCRAYWAGGNIALVPAEEATGDALATAVAQSQTPQRNGTWRPPAGETCSSALAMPLAAQSSLLGAVIVGRQQTGRFRDDHVALLAAVCQPLAVVLLRLRVERLQREFVSIASHEIRTPLTALQGFTELLLSGQAPPDVQRGWLHLMNAEAVRLATLIEEMLDISRIGDGSVPLKPAPIHVVDVVSRVVRLLDSEDQRVQLVIEHAPAVVADGDKLVQVVTNLLRNALDYSPAGSPVEVEVAHRCLAPESHEPQADHDGPEDARECRPNVSVAVRDHGFGMTSDELTHAFQPFYRADASSERAPLGSGLGLSIARTIIDAHHGNLWAVSRAGEGSALGFCLTSIEEEAA